MDPYKNQQGRPVIISDIKVFMAKKEEPGKVLSSYKTSYNNKFLEVDTL